MGGKGNVKGELTSCVGHILLLLVYAIGCHGEHYIGSTIALSYNAIP